MAEFFLIELTAATIFDRRSVRAFTKPPVVFTTFHSK